jgi:tetratricopeptide (TPR) repeat protein/tRNA A-37 threonylcarbamoyl transferase component Bud32
MASPDHTLPDVDVPTAELLAAAPPPPGEPETGRPAWIASVLEGEADREPAVLPLEPGFLVPGTRYRLVGWLGDGGMGVVYEAEHIDLERRVALKIIREQYCRDRELKDMFRAEARAASKVGSEHIVQIYDFSELPDGRLAFAMELLRGALLKHELAAAPLAPTRALGLLRQLCKGLAAAHEARVIHRDVKPGNIVLETVKGRADTVKILDFGIATIVTEADPRQDRGGTPLYVAPEIIEGRPASARSDIYSLGCTAFEMLAGRPPFSGATPRDVLLAHLETPVPDLARLRADVPAPLAEAIARCLAKDPASRPENMHELEALLCEAQIASKLETTWDDLPLPAIDPARLRALAERMPDATRRKAGRRRWQLAAGVAVVAAVAGTWLTATGPDPEVPSRIEELTLAAHAAAAEACWVYPPPDDPQHATAITRVLELEAMGEREAREAAEILRTEFAGTLARLGNEYWAREGGQPFAADFYLQALVFDPDHELAATRALATPGQLAILRDKAQEQSFTRDELVAVAPLAALAEEDPNERQRRLGAIARAERPLPASMRASLDRLVGPADDPPPTAPPPATPPPADEAPPPAVGAAPEAPLAPTEIPTRDRERSRALARDGSRALRGGDVAAATKLFEQALATDESNHAALEGLAQIHYDRGNYETAVRYARKAVAAAPRDAAHRILLGDAYYKAFKLDQAKAQYVEARKLGHPAAGTRLAKVAEKLGG